MSKNLVFFLLGAVCLLGFNSCECDGEIILPDLTAEIEAAGVLRLGQSFQVRVHVINEKGIERCEFDVHQPVTAETLTAVTVQYRPSGTEPWTAYEFGTTAGRTQRLLLDTPPPVDCPGDEHESVVSGSITLYDIGEYQFEVETDFRNDVEERNEANNIFSTTFN